MTIFLIYALLITLIAARFIAISPVSLGFTVLLIALVISILIVPLITSWFRFIIFIIYVGGILVIFSYFAALQPNQHITNWSWGLLPTIIITSLLTTVDFQPIVTPTYNVHINLLFTYQNRIIILFMGLLLFLALIIVVKVSHSYEGPLRPFLYAQAYSKNPPCY